MKKEILPVMFRKSRKDADDVYALFPTLPGTNEPHTCTCYQHVGQHSSADIAGCVASSRPAHAHEYTDLLEELTAIYHEHKLKVMTRESPKTRRARYAALGKTKGGPVAKMTAQKQAWARLGYVKPEPFHTEIQQHYIIDIDSDNDDVIAHIDPDNTMPELERNPEEYGRLFTLAPEMAEALRECDDLIAERMSDAETGCADPIQLLCDVQNAVRAILAKLEPEA